jgi:hypothetical protein
MVEKDLNFRYSWSKQPEAMKANLVDAVAPSTSIQLTSRLSLNIRPFQVRSICPSLLWLVKLLSTIDAARWLTKKTKTAQFPLHANEVVRRTQTPANVAVYN